MRFISSLLCVILFSGQAFATWSIIVINTKTQEIIVASATCVEAINLRAYIAMLEAQAGGGCVQSIGASAVMRGDASALLALGVPPEEILEAMAAYDNLHELRQYGFVDIAGRAATFTGTQCGDWAGGLTGRSGDLVYAIQGNVLTGQPVIDAAEQALINTAGDLSQKVMAAMEAARDMGGDGRCSCSNTAPTSCGAPPPSFTKSAHVGFLISARPGDHPYCDNFACAKGDLYLAINKASLTAADPDPVSEMRIKFDSLRQALVARPDAYLSTVFSYSNKVSAGSTAPQAFVLDLSDVDGNLLTNGGSTITLDHTSRSAGLAILHQVTDHNDGTYTVEVMPGTETGVDELLFVVDDGIRAVTLWPPTALVHEQPLTPLTAEQDINGLQNIDVTFARFTENGLRAWVVGDQQQGGGLEFLELTRADWQTPFTVAANWGIINFPLASLKSFWMSDDGLRMTLAAEHVNGSSIDLFSTSRNSIYDDFAQPLRDRDLNTSGLESSPFLSANELEIWFHANRGNGISFWHATRQSKDARWYPPQRYLESGINEFSSHPTFANNGTEFIFAQRLASSSGYSLFHASRDENGTVGPYRLLSGISPTRTSQRIPLNIVTEPNSNRRALCALTNGTVRQAFCADDTLSVSPDFISLSAGGTFAFQIAAGSSFANGSFTLFPGDLLSSATAVGVIPISLNRYYSRQMKNALTNAGGSLSASGSQSASWTVAAGMNLPPQLIDRNIAFCYIAKSGGDALISQAVVIRVLP